MNRVDRRNQLSRELKDHGGEMPYEIFLAELKLKSNYDAFKHRFRGIFAAMAFRAIAYVDRTAVQPIIPESIRTVVKTELTCDTDADDSVHAHLRCFNLYQASKCFGMKHEHVLVQYFDELLKMAMHAFDNLPSRERKTWSVPRYIYGDNQSKPVVGSTHKVDYTIHFNHKSDTTYDTIHILVEAKSEASGTISDANFGQMADYAQSLWACQPTRLFVPVILIHGAQLSLVVFTRKGWHKVDLGSFAYTGKQQDSKSVGALSDAICKLLYLLALPPQNFGHFCDVTHRIWGDYEFAHKRDSPNHDQDSVLVDVNINTTSTDSSVNIHSRNRIERTINPLGRIAHMFKVKHRGKHAILKISWAPVDQLPESAVYDALKAAKIRDIPSVIDSGIIVGDSFGYRVEYMLIEDYGVPLNKYLQTFLGNDAKRPSNVAARVMHQAVKCIYGAQKVGILHRNITADSVVVKGGQARIIDWGYTKLVNDCAVDVDALAAKWHFNKNKVAGNEGNSAPIIGTPLYTSIPVLVGATQRSIADDVESVLYAFGVAECSELFTWLVDTFRKYIFVRNGEYIGYEMAINPEFERSVEIRQLERILEQIKERIQNEAKGQNASSNTTRPLGNISGRNTPLATTRPRDIMSDRNAPLATTRPLGNMSGRNAPLATTRPLGNMSGRNTPLATTRPLGNMSGRNTPLATTRPLGNISGRNTPLATTRPRNIMSGQNAPPATKHTLEEASSQAQPVETPGAGTSVTKRSRKAAVDKNTEPPRRSKRIQEKKKQNY
ncbi:hypothetical protein IW137_001160 [Coemansia sp. RSA 1287]|nr:hypothetical protein IW137_001160 [Coemansia sp. RSA 1287]